MQIKLLKKSMMLRKMSISSNLFKIKKWKLHLFTCLVQVFWLLLFHAIQPMTPRVWQNKQNSSLQIEPLNLLQLEINCSVHSNLLNFKNKHPWMLLLVTLHQLTRAFQSACSARQSHLQIGSACLFDCINLPLRCSITCKTLKKGNKIHSMKIALHDAIISFFYLFSIQPLTVHKAIGILTTTPHDFAGEVVT